MHNFFFWNVLIQIFHKIRKILRLKLIFFIFIPHFKKDFENTQILHVYFKPKITHYSFCCVKVAWLMFYEETIKYLMWKKFIPTDPLSLDWFQALHQKIFRNVRYAVFERPELFFVNSLNYLIFILYINNLFAM